MAGVKARPLLCVMDKKILSSEEQILAVQGLIEIIDVRTL